MPVQSFASQVLSRIRSVYDQYQGSSDLRSKCRQAISSSITEYIISNTLVTVSYAGIAPPSTPDPITLDTAKVNGSMNEIGGDDFDSWVESLQLEIRNSFTLLPGQLGVMGISPVKPFNGPFPLLLTQELIKTSHLGNYNDPGQKVWETILGQIMLWINSQTGISFPASRTLGGSTGTGIITKIIVT